MGPAHNLAPHHTRLLQDLQLLGDRGLGSPEASGRIPDGGRPGGEPLHDPATDGVGEGLEGIVNHEVNSSMQANGLLGLRRSRLWTTRSGQAGNDICFRSGSPGKAGADAWCIRALDARRSEHLRSRGRGARIPREREQRRSGDVRAVREALPLGSAAFGPERASAAYERSDRGSPKCPKSAVSANQVIAAAASPSSVSTNSPAGRAIPPRASGVEQPEAGWVV